MGCVLNYKHTYNAWRSSRCDVPLSSLSPSDRLIYINCIRFAIVCSRDTRMRRHSRITVQVRKGRANGGRFVRLSVSVNIENTPQAKSCWTVRSSCLGIIFNWLETLETIHRTSSKKRNRQEFNRSWKIFCKTNRTNRSLGKINQICVCFYRKVNKNKYCSTLKSFS